MYLAADVVHLSHVQNRPQTPPHHRRRDGRPDRAISLARAARTAIERSTRD